MSWQWQWWLKKNIFALANCPLLRSRPNCQLFAGPLCRIKLLLRQALGWLVLDQSAHYVQKRCRRPQLASRAHCSASAPAGMRSGADASVAARHTASATSIERVPALADSAIFAMLRFMKSP